MFVSQDVPRLRAMVDDTPGGGENLWPMVVRNVEDVGLLAWRIYGPDVNLVAL